ncbi:MAG: adenylate/guanylate cyclase domain-containing protein [Sciscionella sp.]
MAIKISKEQYSPALFDLSRDVYGGLPIKLVERWLDTERADDDAVRLLKEYEVQGYSVSSDSAGLTSLTGRKGLMEILALINRPKEIVYAYGAAIGGHGVGIWAADNTQMLYPASTGADILLSTLLTVQDEITRGCQVRIGIGAHFGNFYHLSGGLYGVEADAIEDIAENDTAGGEIAVSQSVVDRLPPDHSFTLEPKDIVPTAVGAMYRVLDGPPLVDVQPSDGQYPLPYSEEFYTDLLSYERCLDDTGFAQQLADKYMRHKTVVLIERQAQGSATQRPALLDALALSAMMKDVGLRHLPPDDGIEVKVAGPLGIYLFDEPAVAVRFAQEFRQELAARNIVCRIGIDHGPVLFGELSGGGMDIAGMPVNIASKMAQDIGRPGRMYLSEAIQERVDVAGFERIRYTVSGIQMAAFEG